jgi:peroxiredoxin
MNTRVRFFLFVVLGLIMVVLPPLISCTESKPPDRGKSFPEAMAPDFNLKDLSDQSFKLSTHRGKPVLLIFIATWCPTCRSEMPHYKSIYETYGQRGLEVVNIDIQEPKNRVSQFAVKYQIPYRVLLDKTGDVAGTYGIVGIPAMVLIDKDGKILNRQYLAIDILLETLFGKK